MKRWLPLAIVATIALGFLNQIEANPGYYHHHRPYYCGYPGFDPGYYGYGGFGGSFYGFSTTTFYAGGFAPPPVYGAPFAAGSAYGQAGTGWGGWGPPGFGYGSRMGYQYNYYTHAPGMSFDYYRGPVPTYYPGPFGAPPFDPLNDYGAFGDYGYGPLGW